MRIQMRQRIGKWFPVLMAGALALVPWAQSRADAPAGRYTFSGVTVTDTKTQLTWQRGASDATYTWTGAQAYCSNGWRLPNVKELESLLDVRLRSPAIDPAAFPNTPSEPFWSASPLVNDSNYAWNVNFYGGYTYSNNVGTSFRVRCVR